MGIGIDTDINYLNLALGTYISMRNGEGMLSPQSCFLSPHYLQTKTTGCGSSKPPSAPFSPGPSRAYLPRIRPCEQLLLLHFLQPPFHNHGSHHLSHSLQLSTLPSSLGPLDPNVERPHYWKGSSRRRRCSQRVRDYFQTQLCPRCNFSPTSISAGGRSLRSPRDGCQRRRQSTVRFNCA